MSVESTIYVVAGYDLTGAIGDKFEEFIKDYCSNEHWWCNQTKGEIQLFYDPMCDNHLYFGYILAEVEPFRVDEELISVIEVDLKKKYVQDKLLELANKGVVEMSKLKSPYSVIVFEECR